MIKLLYSYDYRTIIYDDDQLVLYYDDRVI